MFFFKLLGFCYSPEDEVQLSDPRVREPRWNTGTEPGLFHCRLSGQSPEKLLLMGLLRIPESPRILLPAGTSSPRISWQRDYHPREWRLPHRDRFWPRTTRDRK